MKYAREITALVFMLALTALLYMAERRHTCLAGLFGGKCYHECLDQDEAP